MAEPILVLREGCRRDQRQPESHRWFLPIAYAGLSLLLTWPAPIEDRAESLKE
jgi:hypothetical protein